MHIDFDISIEGISKTEGHTSLSIIVKEGKVEDVKLKIKENKRFFTQGIRGKNYKEVPAFLSRICGTCSIAHLLASIEAIEKAFGIEISEQTLIMRKLLTYGLMIRDHAMHLYFFSLPDMFNKDSILEIEDENPEIVKDAFDVKAAGNYLCKIIGGRAVHPTNLVPGGFLKIPKEEDIKKCISMLKTVREKVLRLIEMYYKWEEKFERETTFVALCTEDFSFLEGIIKSSNGMIIKEEDYWDFLNRVVIPYSQATGFQFVGEEYMVGALARINLNKEALNKKTKEDVKNFLDAFPSNNVFYNNLAQAIEILHSIDHSIQILETYEFRKERLPEFRVKQEKGIGVVEAPRGTLYHMLYFDKDGKVRFGNLVIPTAQNQIQMEKDIRFLVQKAVEENRNKHEIQHLVEKLIRAYDPCFSCASHFLKIKWILK
ncbi:MAG: Ni/Fe hydrogenase subunit alpha [Candidatus Aenigmarchaeota archaeon]|nr:Ni/Fe hydrogenase subunit alpha [Candidatus Aenigmarchaeota archaeon]